MKLKTKILFFVVLAISYKIFLPPDLLFANVHTAKYYVTIIIMLGLSIIESLLLAWIIFDVFNKKKPTPMWLFFLSFFVFLLNVLINIKINEFKVENELKKNGVLWVASVREVEYRKRGLYIQLTYEYKSEIYKTPYSRYFGINKAVHVGDSVSLMISKRNPSIYKLW